MQKKPRLSDNLTSANGDTIAALATPPGRGGIGVIRVSGAKVNAILHSILGRDLIPRYATYLPFYDEANQVIDEGIAIFFPHPHSFTGEDVLELQGHGGPVVMDLLLERLTQLGARLARPGEFSERAFLNGKIDLAQAEAIADLIDASSKQAARLAMRSLQGDFSKEIHAIGESIIYLRMYIEAAIDFTDEEIDFLSDKKLKHKLHEVLQQLLSLEGKVKQGSFLREGITAVIAGEPNVGKSSLLNKLSGKETAIVTDLPGTTRDVLRDYILMDGMPIHLIDTAGLRESDDIIEQEGIRRAHHEIEKADIILFVMDATKKLPIEQLILPCGLASRPVIFIQNKIDLLSQAPSIKEESAYTLIALSAKSGMGIDLLKNHIKLRVGYQENIEGIYLARRRHVDALQRAILHIKTCAPQLEIGAGELAAEELRLAHKALGEIIGEFTADDLLGHIFSNFCIGK